MGLHVRFCIPERHDPANRAMCGLSFDWAPGGKSERYIACTDIMAHSVEMFSTRLANHSWKPPTAKITSCARAFRWLEWRYYRSPYMPLTFMLISHGLKKLFMNSPFPFSYREQYRTKVAFWIDCRAITKRFLRWGAQTRSFQPKFLVARCGKRFSDLYD